MTKREWKKFYESISDEAKAERRAMLVETIRRLESIQKAKGTKCPAVFLVNLAKARLELDYLNSTLKEVTA